MDEDRVTFIPPHRGFNVLPNHPLFAKLLRYAHRRPQRVVVRDVNAGVEKTHLQLLTDVLALRRVIETSLSPSVRASLQRGEDVYMSILAPGGYEYTVAFLAILAIGAAAVPLTTALPVEEASYFILKSRAVAVLTASSAITLGQSLEKFIDKSTAHDLCCIPIAPSLCLSTLLPSDILISSDKYLDDNAAGVVIFTSGTTGPPKGAVMRRGFVHDAATAVADHYQLNDRDVILHVVPVHHATGIGITFFPFLISGSCIEFKSGSFDSKWMWERWRRGGLTFFSGVPTIYMRMMRYYEDHLSKLPPGQLEEYIAGAKQFRGLLCGTSALPRPFQKFWTSIRGGDMILTRYGATEFGAVFKVPLHPGDIPDGSVGEIVPGVDLKLSDGDEGEVLVKSPYMFSKYLFNPTATTAAHDADGYFKTGDIATRQGPYYFIVGRASLDIIKSGGYKISALDIERELLGLPYIAEAMVVGVADPEFGQRVGAVVSLREDPTRSLSATDGIEGEGLGDEDRDGERGRLSLERVRTDLRGKLAGYKMPTLLRVVRGELPKTASGKVLKKILGPRYFPEGCEGDSEVQVWKREGEGMVKGKGKGKSTGGREEEVAVLAKL